MKRILLVLVALTALVALPLAARAAEFNAPESGSVVISQTAKNVYTAGNTISTEAKIEGDLVAAGNAINIGEAVEHSIFAIGQSIDVKGMVGQNTRVAGNSINIGGQIGEDLQAAGNSIVLAKTATVGGDAMLAGSVMTIDGTISGWLKGAGDTVNINGEVKGDVKLDANKVIIGDKAVIGGKLAYKSNQKAQIAATAKIAGGVSFEQRTKYDNTFVRLLMTEILTLALLAKLVGGLLLLIVLVYLVPKFSKLIISSATTKLGNAMGIGLVALIVTPIVAVILLVSTIGSSIALVLGTLYALLIILSAHYGTLLIGHAIIKFYKKNADVPLDWRAAVVGVVASAILALVPFAGPLIVFLAMLAALGSLASMLLSTVRNK